MRAGNFAVLVAVVGALSAPKAWAEDITVVCPKEPYKPAEIARSDVYANVPFKAGEEAVYEVTWAGLKAGYGTLYVEKPKKYRDRWHRVFRVHASTGDWFKSIFVAKERVEAISQPWDFGIAKFYLEQNEGKLFSKPFVQQKWLDFDHASCKVHERTSKPGEEETKATFDLARGAIDALGVIYNIRARDLKPGEKLRAPVYTSEKNWWLEADPVAFEEVVVPAGKFKAAKLKLQTFIGKELQQQGDVFAWIAVDHPARPLVQIQGEIKLGSVWVKLHQFKPGK